MTVDQLTVEDVLCAVRSSRPAPFSAHGDPERDPHSFHPHDVARAIVARADGLHWLARCTGCGTVLDVTTSFADRRD